MLISMDGKKIGKLSRGQFFGEDYIMQPNRPFQHRVDSIVTSKVRSRELRFRCWRSSSAFWCCQVSLVAHSYFSPYFSVGVTDGRGFDCDSRFK